MTALLALMGALMLTLGRTDVEPLTITHPTACTIAVAGDALHDGYLDISGPGFTDFLYYDYRGPGQTLLYFDGSSAQMGSVRLYAQGRYTVKARHDNGVLIGDTAVSFVIPSGCVP